MPLVKCRYGILKCIEDHLSAPLAIRVERPHRFHRFGGDPVEAKRTVFVNETVGQAETRLAGVDENARLEPAVVVVIVVELHSSGAKRTIPQDFHGCALRRAMTLREGTYADLY